MRTQCREPVRRFPAGQLPKGPGGRPRTSRSSTPIITAARKRYARPNALRTVTAASSRLIAPRTRASRPEVPAAAEHLGAQVAMVREPWNEAGNRNAEISAWLNNVELVGYTEPVRRLAAQSASSMRTAAAQQGAGIVIRGGAAKGAPSKGKQAGLQWEDRSTRQTLAPCGPLGAPWQDRGRRRLRRTVALPRCALSQVARATVFANREPPLRRAAA